MNTSLFLQCFIFFDLVGWSREKCPKKNPGHETDEGVWMKETRLADFAFRLLVRGYGRQI